MQALAYSRLTLATALRARGLDAVRPDLVQQLDQLAGRSAAEAAG